MKNAPKPSGWSLSLALLALWALVVCQPVLDILAQTPEYWPANKIDSSTLILFTLALTLLPPLLLALVLAAIRRGFRSYPVLAGALGYSSLLLLLAVGIYYPLSLSIGSRPFWLIAPTVLAASLVTYLYPRSQNLRSFLSLCALAAVVVPVNFLLLTPTRSLLLANEPAANSERTLLDLQAPVVMIVFDELSLSSLLDSDGEINSRLFPNFHRLASSSTWFLNATTNYGNTERSVPSLLTGRLQEKNSVSNSYVQNPDNLFTVLKASSGVFAVEPATQLCPPKICEQPASTRTTLLRQLVADFWLIYQNVMVPDRLAELVRPIPKRFHNLASITLDDRDRAATEFGDAGAIVEEFFQWMGEPRRKSLVFLHLMTPHAPYSRNADGSSYTRLHDYAMLGWNPKGHRWFSEAPFYATQGFQRHLLQTAHTDRLLGIVLDRLEETNRFIDSTIIVLADHGVSFEPGDKRRANHFEASLIGSVNAIPLFWKAPSQTEGVRNSKNVELIDVMPTLLEQLGHEHAIETMDGSSMFSNLERPEKLFAEQHYDKNVFPRVLERARRRNEEVLVISNVDGGYFAQPSQYHEFIGKRIYGFSVSETSVEFDDLLLPKKLRRVRKASGLTPNFVQGEIRGREPVKRVAIVMNEVVADVVDIFTDEAGNRKFASVFDPRFLNEGRNLLRVFSVSIEDRLEPTYTLLASREHYFRFEKGTIVGTDDARLKSEPERLIGQVGVSFPIQGQFHAQGWVGDRRTWSKPLALLVMYRDRQHLSSQFELRPHLVKIHVGLRSGGFRLDVPLEELPFDSNQFRLFAIFDEESYAELAAGSEVASQLKREELQRLGCSVPPEPNQELFRYDGTTIVDAAGVPLTENRARLIGAVDRIGAPTKGSVRIHGWIGDRKAWFTPKAYLVVYRDNQQLSSQFSLRPDLIKVHKCLEYAGFAANVPLQERLFDREQLRMFVIFHGDTFAELEMKTGFIQ